MMRIRRRPQRRRLGRRRQQGSRPRPSPSPSGTIEWLLLIVLSLLLGLLRIHPASAFRLAPTPRASSSPPSSSLAQHQQQQQQRQPHSRLSRPPFPLAATATTTTSSSSSHDDDDDEDDAEAESFSFLYRGQLPPWLLVRTEALGFQRPTQVQRAALRPILEGEDVIVHAQTGTGKTLAFLLPLLAGIDPNKRAVQALVVVPSRELGLQVASVCKRLAAGRAVCRDEGAEEGEDEEEEEDDDMEGGDEEEGDEAARQQPQDEEEEEEVSSSPLSKGDKKILIMSLLEGSKNRRQRAWAIAEPPHVVIGNPRALSRLVEQGGIRYHQVRMVVIDEVDACLVSKETRAELQALLGKYLSPSYLTAALEEEASSGGASGGGSEEDRELLASLPQGVVKDGGGGGGGDRGQLAPWRLARRQTVFCSATIPQHNHFMRQCVQQQWTLREPMHVQVTPGELVPPHLRHGYLVCPTKAEKLAVLRAFLRREAGKGRMEAAVVFAADEEEARAVVAALSSSSFSALDAGAEGDGGEEKEEAVALFLTSRDNIRKRAQVMESFREGKAPVLVTTDFAARGLDVPRVSHVLMYDIPGDAETYLHRGGRAGRMGRPGTVASLVSETEAFALLRLANSLKIEVKRLGAMKKKKQQQKKKAAGDD